jgi:SPW repeat
MLLTGLWIAISPWFLTLQSAGATAKVTDLIVGLAVTALAMLPAVGLNRVTLPTATALAGAWAIVAPLILTAKFPITASMYWSNS